MVVAGLVTDVHHLERMFREIVISSSTHLLLHLVIHVCVADHGEGVAARWRSLHLSHPDCIDVRT